MELCLQQFITPVAFVHCGAISACSTVSAVRPVKTDAMASYERVEYKINLNVPMTPD